MKKIQKNLNRRLNELRGLVGIPGQDNLGKLIKKGQNLLDSGASRHEILDFDSEIHKHMIANPIPKDLPKKKKKTKPSIIKTENNIPNKKGPPQKSKYPQSSSRNKKNDSNLKKLLGKAFPSDEKSYHFALPGGDLVHLAQKHSGPLLIEAVFVFLQTPLSLLVALL